MAEEVEEAATEVVEVVEVVDILQEAVVSLQEAAANIEVVDSEAVAVEAMRHTDCSSPARTSSLQ